MNFCSDNVTGASPEILDAIQAANDGPARAYGDDDWTAKAEQRIADLFETDAAVFLVATGTAANALCLSAMVPPFGAVFCHKGSHANVDECGAPEFYTGGAKLMDIDGPDGKLTVEGLAAAADIPDHGVHAVQPRAITITQASEAGTLYPVEDIAALADAGRQRGLRLHMDGARFANAVAALDKSPAELTWKAGVSALSFGASKNGALAAEAIVLFDKDLAETMGYRRKRAGHLFSKMRFLAAQWLAYLDDDLWLRNARHANAMAARLATGLSRLDGVSFAAPTQANEVFAYLPEPMIVALETAGFGFYRWPSVKPGLVRLVSAFNTDITHVDKLLNIAE